MHNRTRETGVGDNKRQQSMMDGDCKMVAPMIKEPWSKDGIWYEMRETHQNYDRRATIQLVGHKILVETMHYEMCEWVDYLWEDFHINKAQKIMNDRQFGPIRKTLQIFGCLLLELGWICIRRL